MSAQVTLKEYVDIKDFRSLMEKNNIKIVKEKKDEDDLFYLFAVDCDHETLEEILNGTNIRWGYIYQPD